MHVKGATNAHFTQVFFMLRPLQMRLLVPSMFKRQSHTCVKNASGTSAMSLTFKRASTSIL